MSWASSSERTTASSGSDRGDSTLTSATTVTSSRPAHGLIPGVGLRNEGQGFDDVRRHDVGADAAVVVVLHPDQSIRLRLEKLQGCEVTLAVGEHLALQIVVGRAARGDPMVGLALDGPGEIAPERFREVRVSLALGLERLHDEIE